MAAIVRTADIVVAAAGRPHLLTPDMVKPGAAVVSAGTTFEGKKLIPDAHPDVAEVAGWITPRLGGVGPMTRAMLLRNALRARRRSRSASPAEGRRPWEARVSEREYSERPWGNYTVLDDDAPDHKVKRLVVHPGKRLSYQRHSKRAEHWFIVAGTATVTLDGTVITVEAGQAIDIPLEGAHRIANEGDTDVVLIEVQHGTYFGEDDIVRLEDDFGRVAVVTRIAELLAAGPTYSFEFFPPKNDKELGTLARTIAELQPLEPSFVSVTYRGGAESRQRTFDLVSGMLHTTKLNPMAHLICVAHTRLELADILVSLRKAGRREPHGPRRRPARGPRRRPRRAGLRGGAGGAGPRHRRLLHRRGGPPGRPPALARRWPATATSWPPSWSWPTSG